MPQISPRTFWGHRRALRALGTWVQQCPVLVPKHGLVRHTWPMALCFILGNIQLSLHLLAVLLGTFPAPFSLSEAGYAQGGGIIWDRSSWWVYDFALSLLSVSPAGTGHWGCPNGAAVEHIQAGE